ncbi:MAG TPA: 16S rRNA (uracil(1498)-N(3))-methyltransferase [Bacteroidia bacterium]|nr:16S rRNA (uracil(1498)-N(3))-methyltransferase [Bacteroidia bacterium]
MNLFFREDIATSLIDLDAEESRHCIKVLRLHNGSIIHITDGKGNLAEAVIVDGSIRNCSVEIRSREKKISERNYQLSIAIAPTKNHDRFEWFVEKATEIGIDKIIPLICSHSERRTVKTERLKNISIAALKQSQKIFLPEISEPVLFEKYVKTNNSEQKFICTCEAELSHHLKNICKSKKNYSLLIGPEGDFSPEEIKMALENGFIEASLGNTRLRTETAGIIACSLISFINN